MKAPLKGLLSLLGGDVAMRAIGFVVTAYLARVLEPAAFGMISVGMAVLGYLQLIGSPGIQILETRNVAAATQDLQTRAGAVLSLRIVLALILIIAAALVIRLFVANDSLGAVIFLHAMSLVPMALFLDWVLQGKERFLSLSVARTAGYLAYALSVLLLVRAAGDVRLAPIGFFLGNVITALLLWAMVTREHTSIALSWNPGAWKKILAENLPVGTALLLGQMVMNLPPLLLAALMTNADVGIYSAAIKLVFLFLLLDRVLNAMLLPAAARFMSSRPDEVHRLFSLALKVVLLGALPLAVSGIIASSSIVRIVFGVDYAASAPILRILMGYVALTLLNSVFVCIVLGAKREKAYLRVITTGTIVLVAATVVLTLWMGLAGTALGVVLGEGMTALLMGREAASVTPFPALRSLMKPWIGLAGMAAAAWVLRNQDPLVMLSGSLAVFAIVIAAIRALVPEELRYLREKLI